MRKAFLFLYLLCIASILFYLTSVAFYVILCFLYCVCMHMYFWFYSHFSVFYILKELCLIFTSLDRNILYIFTDLMQYAVHSQGFKIFRKVIFKLKKFICSSSFYFSKQLLAWFLFLSRLVVLSLFNTSFMFQILDFRRMY